MANPAHPLTGRKHPLNCGHCKGGWKRPSPIPEVERFWSRVDKSGECWVWTGARSTGYGQFFNGGQTIMAHRWAYEQEHGPIGSMQLDHLCRNPPCVRPDHLEPVTPAENKRRGLQGVLKQPLAACVQGHPYTAANTYIRPNGARYCRQCHREAATRAYRSRQRS